MYKNQFFLFVIACASFATNICATEETAPQPTDDVSVIASNYESASTELAPAHEIALRIKDGEIKQGNMVAYENEEYTVTELNITTNENCPEYYNIRYSLEKPTFCLGMQLGTETLRVYVRNGIEPIASYEKIRNPDVINNTQLVVEVNRYNNVDHYGPYYTAKETINSIFEKVTLASMTGALIYALIAVGRQANRIKK